MKIAVLGAGGREHAIADKFAQSIGWKNIFTLPGNAGIPNSHDIAINNFEGIQDFCIKNNIELIFVGPEIPLTNGIVDFFDNSPIKVFGPDKHAAQLEGSKIWAKNFMNKYGIKTAESRSFNSIAEAQDFAVQKNGNIVIKYDGLAGGKGVFVCSSIQETEQAFIELEQQYGKKFPFLIEDKISGNEISIIGFTDGKNIQLLLPSQDHKQLLEGDKGPNTGGMGVFSPVPFCDEALIEAINKEIITPTLKGIQSEAFDFRGFLFFGMMLTEKGPKLLEYNVRFGDPEAEVMLPALESDLLSLLLATLSKEKTSNLSTKELKFKSGYFVDVVQVSGGYPGKYEKGFLISGLESIEEETLVFHAGTRKEHHRILSNGGRVLNVVAHGDTLEEAITKVYKECGKISFKNNFYRKDIGTRKKS